MVDDATLTDLMGVPEAISRLGHPVAVPALASGALPVIQIDGARRVRRADVLPLSMTTSPLHSDNEGANRQRDHC